MKIRPQFLPRGFFSPRVCLAFLLGLIGALLGIAGFGCRHHVVSNSFSYAIDPTVVASSKDLVAVVDDRGHQFEYSPDQIVVHPRDRAALDAFVARYHGTILSDGSKPRTRVEIVAAFRFKDLAKWSVAAQS